MSDSMQAKQMDDREKNQPQSYNRTSDREDDPAYPLVIGMGGGGLGNPNSVKLSEKPKNQNHATEKKGKPRRHG